MVLLTVCFLKRALRMLLQTLTRAASPRKQRPGVLLCFAACLSPSVTSRAPEDNHNGDRCTSDVNAVTDSYQSCVPEEAKAGGFALLCCLSLAKCNEQSAGG